MRPDGTERKRVPLPPGYFYIMPAFVPGGGVISEQQNYLFRPDKKWNVTRPTTVRIAPPLPAGFTPPLMTILTFG